MDMEYAIGFFLALFVYYVVFPSSFVFLIIGLWAISKKRRGIALICLLLAAVIGTTWIVMLTVQTTEQHAIEARNALVFQGREISQELGLHFVGMLQTHQDWVTISESAPKEDEVVDLRAFTAYCATIPECSSLALVHDGDLLKAENGLSFWIAVDFDGDGLIGRRVFGRFPEKVAVLFDHADFVLHPRSSVVGGQ